MKRAPSDSASPPSSPVITPKYERRDTDDEYAPSDPPTPTPSSQKRAHQTPKKQRTENRGLASAKKVLTSKNDWEPGWTPDKKEAIIDEILNAGLKAISQTELCRKVSWQCNAHFVKRELGN